MNARDFFYKGYYHHEAGRGSNRVRFNPGKPGDKILFKELKKSNKPIIEDANKMLQNFTLQPEDYQCLRLNRNNYSTEISEIELTTTYPGLIIGAGYTHQSDNEAELKMGFYFDHSSGLPCIPGSSVKGVLRSVFPQLGRKLNAIPETITEIQQSKAEMIAELAGWSAFESTEKLKKVHQFELTIFEGADLENTKESRDNEYLGIYDRFIFYNAYISGAKGDKIFETDSITPHPDPLEDPTPLNFLKIRPAVRFCFQFTLQNIPKLGLNKNSVLEIFKNILAYTGAGAKTNVGYGQFKL
jgi:CRISPR-associated protein Cmr6